MSGEKYVLVQHSDSINAIIQNIFQTTQRIKFTAFDVSQKYIVIGVNSGGIYIFNREPCQFLKLIPSTNGPTNLIAISDNEEDLALSMTNGFVILLENCFADSLFQQQIFSEHENATVTALKWSGHELYCGDSTGKVSVITLRPFLTKAIFQPPQAVLMNLDSAIVQLDTYSHFLLVSTMTRSLLCDTQQERFRQIGKKLRDGPFGACFFNTAPEPTPANSSNEVRSSFQAFADNELMPNGQNLKIFCARPGVRLWQVDGQATVICTHQFRASLAQNQAEFILFDNVDRLTITKCDNCEPTVPDFTFGKLYKFMKFVLAFQEDGFYIFEPLSSSLLFWSGKFKKIKNVKIFNSYLYIWHNTLEISVISLVTIEEIILMNLLRKHYVLCAELCVNFQEDVIKLLVSSKKIHLISILDAKLAELGQTELRNRLKRLFERLNELSQLPTLEKLKSGIVRVHNVYEQAQSSAIPSSSTIHVKTDMDILVEQYRLSKIHKEIETHHFRELIKTKTVSELFELVQKFMGEEPESAAWCGETYLRCIKDMQGDFGADDLHFGKSTFFELNGQMSNCWKCKFPVPLTRSCQPKHCESGVRLMTADENGVGDFLQRVPYMYKFQLEKIADCENVRLNLAVLVQFSDVEIWKGLSRLITYDVWDEAFKLLLKLRKGVCLNCSEGICVDGAMEIECFALLIVQSIRAGNAIKLLKRYAKELPRGVLDSFFYEYCIFQSVTNMDFSTDILRHEQATRCFDKSIESYLRRKYVLDSDDLTNKVRDDGEKCDFCEFKLQIPLIEDNAKKLQCGHNFHEVCYLYKNKQCFICNLNYKEDVL